MRTPICSSASATDATAHYPLLTARLMDQAETSLNVVDGASALSGQPLARVTRDGVEYTILGTAHVSRASVTAVQALMQNANFDAVAVELCDSRYRAMRDPEAWRNLDLLNVIRQGKAGMVAANLALSAYQRRLAEQF